MTSTNFSFYCPGVEKILRISDTQKDIGAISLQQAELRKQPARGFQAHNCPYSKESCTTRKKGFLTGVLLALIDQRIAGQKMRHTLATLLPAPRTIHSFSPIAIYFIFKKIPSGHPLKRHLAARAFPSCT